MTQADVAEIFALDQRCFPVGIAYSAEEIAAYLRMPGFHQGCSRAGRLAAVLLSALGKREGRAGDPGAPGPAKRQAGGVAQPHQAPRQSIGRGHVITVDVAPEARRQGIGQELMRNAEAYYRARGARGMRLEAAVNNAGALAFYARLGYHMTRLLPGYYAADLDALRLELDF